MAPGPVQQEIFLPSTAPAPHYTHQGPLPPGGISSSPTLKNHMALKKKKNNKEILSVTTIRMDLVRLMLSEISPRNRSTV